MQSNKIFLIRNLNQDQNYLNCRTNSKALEKIEHFFWTGTTSTPALQHIPGHSLGSWTLGVLIAHQYIITALFLNPVQYGNLGQSRLKTVDLGQTFDSRITSKVFRKQAIENKAHKQRVLKQWDLSCLIFPNRVEHVPHSKKPVNCFHHYLK